MSIPERIGRYAVRERSRLGAQAEELSGLDPRSGRAVTIKLCTAEEEIVRQRFLAQVEANAAMEHANVVAVVDLGRERGAPFAVEEDAAGERLEAVIARRDPQPERRKLEWLLQVARALDHAHGRGVLHGGLTPSAVRVDGDAPVKVGDFGLAGFLAPSPGAGPDHGRSGPLSPEEVLGLHPDTRSDVFAFGSLAFELLTYAPPFDAAGVAERLALLLERDPPSVKAVWPACPAEVANLVDACLRKDPDRRPQSFFELAEELESILHSPRQETLPALLAPPPPPPWDEDLPPAVDLASGPVPPGPVAWPAPGGEPVPGGIAATTAAKARRRWVWAAVGAAAVAMVVAIVLWAARRPITQPQAGSPLQEGTALGPAATSSALLRIDARPWAEILRVVDAEGRAVPLPAAPYTPLALAVEPGAYRVIARRSGEAAPAECEARVEVAGDGTCRLEFEEVDAERYFREAGWWR